MDKMIMTLFARTPVHLGCGNSVGTVDAPVQRERHTKMPLIPGSSLKGVLSDCWNGEDYKRTAAGKELFGDAEGKGQDGIIKAQAGKAQAGKLLIGEGRLLAFPVRSAKGMFAWLTCPLALRRFKRDWGWKFDIPLPEDDEVLASDKLVIKKDKNSRVILEEYTFNPVAAVPQNIINELKGLAPEDPVWQQLDSRLAVVSDEMFQYFCQHACPIVTRVAIDDEKGTAKDGALFNLEQVPSETLFYSLIMARERKFLEELQHKMEQEQWLQIGGDATVGLGFCSVHCMLFGGTKG